MFRTRRQRDRVDFAKRERSGPQIAVRLQCEEQGSAILEFAITLPLLVVFVVGIYDFSGAFNQKQKIDQAAQEGAIVSAAQPMSDIEVGNGDPDSLHPVVTAVFNSLVGSGVLPTGTCTPPGAPRRVVNLTWRYRISGCSVAHPGDKLDITIDRGISAPGPPVTVGTTVTVSYPYHWQFDNVIQLLVPGANYASRTTLTESATVHNQM